MVKVEPFAIYGFVRVRIAIVVDRVRSFTACVIELQSRSGVRFRHDPGRGNVLNGLGKSDRQTILAIYGK